MSKSFFSSVMNVVPLHSYSDASNPVSLALGLMNQKQTDLI